MKKITVLIIFLTSLSVFSYEDSDYERGYKAGARNVDTSAICVINTTVDEDSKYKVSFIGTGDNKAEAVRNAISNCERNIAEYISGAGNNKKYCSNKNSDGQGTSLKNISCK